MGMGVGCGCGALKEIDDLIEMKGEIIIIIRIKWKDVGCNEGTNREVRWEIRTKLVSWKVRRKWWDGE